MEMTKEELKWCKSLQRVIQSMPNSLELVIGMHNAHVLEEGSVLRNLEAQGHQDNPELFSDKRFFFQFKGGVYGNESQI